MWTLSNLLPEQFINIARTDPKKIIESLFFIQNKDAQIVPLKFNEVQDDFYSLYKRALSGDIRALIDILKARQQGFSSLVLALFTVDFLIIPNIWCVCVSHESEATKRLFRKVRMYIDRLPFTIPLDTSRTDMIVNKMTGSVFYVGTAGSRAFGQGDTIHRLHLSEFSRYQDPERLIKNIIPAVPKDGIIVKETTANGANNYHHREWLKEKKGEAVFSPYFSPWYKSREYAIEVMQPIVMTGDERKVQETYKLTDAQMNWRRQEISRLGSVDSFKESYPINDLEAFISSGASAFDKESLMWMYENTCKPAQFKGILDDSSTARFQSDDKGWLQIWEKPMPNSQYYIPADTAKSGDYCSASVMKWGTNEQVATVHGHFEPDEWGKILYKLGAWYNYATIIPESNGIGAGAVATLRVLMYEKLYTTSESPDDKSNNPIKNYGFDTNVRTRPLIIACGQKAIRERGAIIHDAAYVMEMQSFKRNRDGKYEAAPDENGANNDDRVMEFLIGQYFYQTNPIPEPEGFGRINPIATPDEQNLPGSMITGSIEGYDDFGNV